MLDDLGVIEVISVVIPVNSSDRPEVTKLKLYARVLYNRENISETFNIAYLDPKPTIQVPSPKFFTSICIMNLILVI